MLHSSRDIDDLLHCHHTSDPAIIYILVECYRPMLYRLAYSILSDPDEAEDAVQEAILSAVLHLDDYHIGTNFRAWLYTVTVNTCRSHLRKQLTRHRLISLLQGLHRTSANAESPEDVALKDEAAARLWEAVDRLSQKYRLVIVLRIVHELTIPEIAQILSLNQKTVYTRLYAALRKLRSQLEISGDIEWTGKEVYR
jgi:RNA polymerase sigma-70 factor (ECF subfamily)